MEVRQDVFRISKERPDPRVALEEGSIFAGRKKPGRVHATQTVLHVLYHDPIKETKSCTTVVLKINVLRVILFACPMEASQQRLLNY